MQRKSRKSSKTVNAKEMPKKSKSRKAAKATSAENQKNEKTLNMRLLLILRAFICSVCECVLLGLVCNGRLAVFCFLVFLLKVFPCFVLYLFGWFLWWFCFLKLLVWFPCSCGLVACVCLRVCTKNEHHFSRVRHGQGDFRTLAPVPSERKGASGSFGSHLCWQLVSVLLLLCCALFLINWLC